MRRTATALLLLTTLATPSGAADTPVGGIDPSKAWTQATTSATGDAPLYMTITNRASVPDSLLRIRCPTDLADFTVKHATDRGEGGTAMREVKSFEIPAGGTLTLAPGGDHLMLLSVRQPFHQGDTFTCSLVFRTAGTVTVAVTVAAADATAAP